ncbi:hypothetical protein CDS [Bradyrhizobium sp.]|nr:hypothetical protein CDS [Bradyrhizobium sp.]
MSFVGHGYSGGKGGKQDAASVEHGSLPASLFLRWDRNGITSAG